MAIATSSQLSKLLKEQYEGPIREQLNLEALIYRLLLKARTTGLVTKLLFLCIRPVLNRRLLPIKPNRLPAHTLICRKQRRRAT